MNKLILNHCEIKFTCIQSFHSMHSYLHCIHLVGVEGRRQTKGRKEGIETDKTQRENRLQ
jgi:hypothetical protein